MKKIILSIILGIFLLTLVSAQIPIVKQGNPINITATCDNCTNVNLTLVTYPNQTIALIGNYPMIKNDTNYIFSFTDTNSLGVYTYSTCGDLNGVITCQDTNDRAFQVTTTGSDLSTSKIITYLIIFVISIFIFVGLIVAGISLPSENSRDAMTGYIIAVSNLKYVKIFCFFFAYLIALFLSYFTWMISYAYLDFNFITTLAQFLFYGLAICTVVLFPLMVYILIANWTRDSELKDMLSRGIRTK